MFTEVRGSYSGAPENFLPHRDQIQKIAFRYLARGACRLPPPPLSLYLGPKLSKAVSVFIYIVISKIFPRFGYLNKNSLQIWTKVSVPH